MTHPRAHPKETDGEKPVAACEEQEAARPGEELPPGEAAPSQAETAAASPPELEALRKELEQARARIDQLTRHAAELDNVRKRALRDREREVADKQASILRSILPVMDSFERALQSLNASTDPEAIRLGTGQIFQLFSDFLSKQGVKSIESVGKTYDPHLHEAVFQAPSEDFESGLVSAEVEKGYYLNEKVLRHSRVVVSSGAAVVASSEATEPSESAPPPTDEKETA